MQGSQQQMQSAQPDPTQSSRPPSCSDANRAIARIELKPWRPGTGSSRLCVGRAPAVYMHHGQSRGARVQGLPDLTDTAVHPVCTSGLSIWVCSWGQSWTPKAQFKGLTESFQDPLWLKHSRSFWAQVSPCLTPLHCHLLCVCLPIPPGVP